MTLIRATSVYLLCSFALAAVGGCISITRYTSPDFDDLRVDKKELRKHIKQQEGEVPKYPLFQHQAILQRPDRSGLNKLENDLTAALKAIQTASAYDNGLLVTLVQSVSTEPGMAPLNIKDQLGYSGRTTLVLQEDDKPYASAYSPADGSRPKILVNSALVNDILQAHMPDVRPSEFFQNQYQRAELLDEEDIMGGADIGLDITEEFTAYTLLNREYASAVFFVLGHEYGHIIFNDKGSATTPFNEARADLFAVVVTELVYGKMSAERAANEQLVGNLSWSSSDMSEIINLTSSPGFEAFLRVYQNTSFAEGNSTHIPIEDRISMLEKLHADLTTAQF